MTVLVWILTTLAVLVALVCVIVVGALLSWLHVEGRYAEAGGSGRGRWGMLDVEVDGPSDRLVVRLLGWRIVRRSLRGDAAGAAADHASGASEKPKEERHRRGGERLSIASYRRLARTGWRELRRSLRHLHVDRLRLEAVVASDDPALTGEVYGFGCAVLGAVRGWWPEADLHLSADFTSTQPRGAGELAIGLRPVRLVPGAVRVGWSYWQERRRSGRRA